MHGSTRRVASLVIALSALAVSAAGCGGNSDEPYKPQPAWSGKKASLPAPPSLPNTPIKTGDAYTIYGASHHLRSLIHSKDVTANTISIVGYIVDSNIPRAPDCAVHPAGKQDPENCVAEIPSFWVGDQKGADPKAGKIRVIGWARNFAIIYDAIKEYDKSKDPPKELVKDDILNVDIPYPIPAVGAKVKITGKYGFSGRNSSDMVSDPVNGVFMLQKIEYLEPAPDKAAFAKKI
jgi:hypothetical protein